MTNTDNLGQSHYKVVEISTVTDETIETALNLWTARGWRFDQIQFVVRDSSRRPAMAFVFFTRPVLPGESPRYDVHHPIREPDAGCPESEDDQGDIL